MLSVSRTYNPIKTLSLNSISLSLFYLTLALTQAQLQNNAAVVLNKCPDFKDSRRPDDTNTTILSNDIFITIPGNLTNTDEHVHFRLDSEAKSPFCTSPVLKTVSWEDGENLKDFASKVRGFRLANSSKTSTHFTHDGDFHVDGHFYSPGEYCVTRLSEMKIALRVCKVDCSDNSDITCIPKCCGVNEILEYWKFACRKLKPHEQRWKPKLHGLSYPHKPLNIQDMSTKLHFTRHDPGCMFFEQWPLSETSRPKDKTKPPDAKIRWKLLESQRPVFLGDHRRWTHIPEGSYCVDGFANFGKNYSGQEEMHSVILLCSSDQLGGPEFSPARAWTYVSALLVSSSFLLLTALIHLLLIDRQHLHGLVVLCHSTSMYFMYIFCAIAHIVSIFPSLKGTKPRGGFCLSVAILSHYFFMTTFTWLTVMNFDLWLTFRSMRPVSKMSKRIRRFRLYSLIGWGLPLCMSSAFYYVDEFYRDLESEVVVPDYGQKSCFVAVWSRGYYMYSLVAIALSINTVLVLWTFYIFYEFRKQNANTFTNRKSQSEKYSVRLFCKLFAVMGVAWFVELLSWYYNGESKPWGVVALDCLMFFQAFAIFFIFCMNRRTLKQLEEKYSCLNSIIGPIRRYNWFKAHSDADGNVEMTTPGSTPRKLSLSVTTNTKIDSTLPRKSSSASVRSTASNSKHLSNGSSSKMESINLDSDTEHENISRSTQRGPDLISNMC